MMSFKCEKCNKVHEGKQHLLVTEVRPVLYVELNPIKNHFEYSIFHYAYKGFEIGKSLKICEHCYDINKENLPIIIEEKIVQIKKNS